LALCQEFAIDTKLADASRNQMVVLTSVINDDDFGLGHRTSKKKKKRAKPETVFARNKPQEKGEMFVS
jgi:hypothetical protein